MEQVPDKVDITNIFKRLRNIPANKICFDCGAKNPTWASVTYGVFICMDCSAVHRSLGVHLSFVRSTQLDTNWTWLQLRAMQVGGNSKAKEFFQHHNHTTTDSQQKYNSKVASLYREKLHNLASSAMRIHGTKAIIDSNVNEICHSPEKKDVDFFQELTKVEHESSNGSLLTLKPAMELSQNPAGPEPSVELLINSSMNTSKQREQKTISLLNKNAKKGLGAKRGLGAQRIATDFKTIEKEVENLEIMKERTTLETAKRKELEKEEEEKKLASMRLAYQDLSLQQKKFESKMKENNAQKAEQLERLGMGLSGNISSSMTHSATSDMKVIQQSNPQKAQSTKSKDFTFEDDFEFIGFSLGPPKYGDSPFISLRDEKNNDTLGGSKASWEEKMLNKPKKTTPSEREDVSMKKKNYSIPASTSDEAQKLFGNAKSISSSQFFGNDRDSEIERRANLSKFESSTSISSAEYFGKPQPPESSVPNLQDIKDGVRGGVTRVAGRLSNIASGVITSIQDKYGY